MTCAFMDRRSFLPACAATLGSMGTYVFDEAWRKEDGRLAALESLSEPSSQRHLAGLGAADGWRCSAVGAGGVWLADRVGPTGQVLATDLGTRFLSGRRSATEAGRDVLAR